MAGILGPLISGAFGLGSSLLSNKGALQRQQLADRQNIRFWEMQNAYNTPAQQMARLKKAGLNPALIYGSGSANTGVAGAVAPSKPAPYNIKNPVPLQAMLLEAQIGNIKADTLKKEADANSVNTLLGGKKTNLDLRNEIQTIKNDIAGKTKQQQINIIRQSSLQSDFNTKIKEVDQEAAISGFPKGNTIYTIFAQLGIADDSETSKTIRKALIGGLLGSQIFGQLSKGIQNLIPKKGTTNIRNQFIE